MKKIFQYIYRLIFNIVNKFTGFQGDRWLTPFMRNFTVFLFSVFSTIATQAQLTVSMGMSPQQLVQNVLLGTGVTVSNVTYSGSNASIGHFTGGGSSNLGLSSGVVMSTGLVNGNPALGSPVGNFASTDLGLGGDADLLNLAGGSVCQDASVLQFDFIPLSDTIKFRYVFASEEYPEYVCSIYNDVFGFFLSGPGINGTFSNNSINMAKIPGTNLPVAINSVNNGGNGTTYSLSDCISTGFSSDYIDNEAIGGSTVVFDGFTVVFTAWHIVQPCQTYHIKLAIGDIGDGEWDSAVFLDAGSFSSTSVAVASTTTNSVLASDSTAIEGCTDNLLTFTRSGSGIGSPLTVQLNISGTAINGVDYNLLPTSITFPPGQTTTTLVFHPIWNGIFDGPKVAIISIPQITPCTIFEPKVTLHIYDPNPINVTLRNDTSIICPIAFNIPANASGGNGALTYIWDNGLGTNSSITVTPYNTTTYIVTVRDACALLNAIDSVTITMPPYDLLRAYPSPDLTTCPGDSVTLSATATGGIGNYSFLWSNGLGTNSTVSVAPMVTTTYSVSVTDSCGLVASGNVTVTVMTVLAEFTYEYISNNEVHFIDQSVNDVSFQWDFGDGQSSDLQFPTHLYADTGIYIVQLTVTNAEGCISIVQHAIQIYPPYHLYVPNAFTPDGDGLNDYFAPIAVGVVQSEMYIFDRWGGQIYESSELNPHWDGRDSNGEKVQLGVYVYLLIYNTPTGQQHTRRGSVTLLR